MVRHEGSTRIITCAADYSLQVLQGHVPSHSVLKSPIESIREDWVEGETHLVVDVDRSCTSFHLQAHVWQIVS